jgi:hypothetical protein
MSSPHPENSATGSVVLDDDVDPYASFDRDGTSRQRAQAEDPMR